jgi:hypothetical protein
MVDSERKRPAFIKESVEPVELLIQLSQNIRDVVLRFGVLWDSPFLVYAARTRVIRAEREREVTAVFREELFQEFSAGVDVLFGIEGIVYAKMIGRCGHDLH